MCNKTRDLKHTMEKKNLDQRLRWCLDEHLQTRNYQFFIFLNTSTPKRHSSDTTIIKLQGFDSCEQNCSIKHNNLQLATFSGFFWKEFDLFFPGFNHCFQGTLNDNVWKVCKWNGNGLALIREPLKAGSQCLKTEPVVHMPGLWWTHQNWLF